MSKSAPDRPCEAEIRYQIDRLLSSRRFRDASTLGRMLRFIVDAALEGTAASLNATVIAHRALGKGPGFQSSKDSSVRVSANRLRIALRLYYLEDGRHDDVVISLAPGSYEPVIEHRSPTSVTPHFFDEAAEIMNRYLAIATQESHASTSLKIDEMIAQNPGFPTLLAAKADLLMDAYKHGYSSDPGMIDEAQRMIEQAVIDAPEDEYVIFASALAALHNGNRRQVAELARDLAADPDDANRALGLWFLTLVGDGDAQFCKSEMQLFSKPGLPGWIHHAPFLAAYSDGDYETALCAGIRFGMPNWFWGSIDRSSALAQLGLNSAATAELENAAAKCPALLTDTDRILGAYIPDLETRAHVREGLERAGLRELA